MIALDTRDLCAAADGALYAGGHGALGPAVIDSRAAVAGSVFFCLSGPRFDGHDFVAQAVGAGARVVVAARSALARLPKGLDATVVAVESPEAALQAIAAEKRLRFGGEVVAVTGSVGKTTTKEMLAAVLSRGGATHRTQGNLNNHLGVPLTLLALRGDERFAVVEMGMNHAGEIALLCALARPRVGVVTAIGAAHLEGLGSVEAIAAAKGELFTALPADGVAIAPSDLAHREIATAHLRARLVTVGTRADDEVRLLAFDDDGAGARGTVSAGGRRAELRLRMAGEHNLRNALLAVAAGRVFGIDLEAAVAALAEVPPPSMRGEVRTLPDGGRVVLDCYNANPVSMAAALASFARTAPPGGVLVLGDMRELGPEAVAAHAALARDVMAMPDATLIAVGPLMGALADAARAAGMPRDHVVHVADAAQAGAELRARRLAGGWVLVKGSRAMALERVMGVFAPAGEA